MQDTGCPPAASTAKLRFESLDLSKIPGQSKLFIQYQSDPASLRKYYPSAVTSHTDVASRRDEVLQAYEVDRRELCDILVDQNRRFGAGPQTLRHLELLREKDTVAVLTGQQAGLLTGPLYTIYKALSAIKMAECLRERGIAAVPIFWAATEDHDFDEIARAFMLDATGAEFDLTLPPADDFAGRPVGTIPISEAFARSLKHRLDSLPASEFASEVRKLITDTWIAGRTIGEAFCSHLQQLFRDHGLIVVDPFDPRLKQLSAPILAEVVRRAEEIVPALLDRSKELEIDGYHAQVLINPEYFPSFYFTDDGVRRALRKRAGGYRIADTDLELTKDKIAEIATNEPQRLSAGVMCRPVVQDYLFPTICYFGGAAEIAYFAQNSEVYRILDRPVTPIMHRQSFTIIEAKHARTMDKYGLGFTDLFAGLERLLPRIVEDFVNPTTSRLFADGEDHINTELNRIDRELSRIDPTLADNLATRRRKILYHIHALRKKFHRVQIERDEIVNRQLRTLFNALLPDGQLQERRLNVSSFTSHYGPYFIDWIYDSVDLEERGHRLLYL